MGDGDEDIGAPGHRVSTDTADLTLEAWAPNKMECVAEAVRALVASFAEIGAARPDGGAAFAVDAPTPEELFTLILDEAIHQVTTYGVIPIDTSIDERTGVTEGRADVRFATIPITQAHLVGPIPRAVSMCVVGTGDSGGAWHCRVTVAV